ncbi:MAG: type I restriction-modification system subunit M [Pseudomonadales bacterium]|nr:type I restriction-modification system subunit M [Pseudomonadales bacterium]
MNKQQLAAKIWESANQMRSKIEANEYKDYILGFIFYKYVSDKQLEFARQEEFTEEDIRALSEDDQETVEHIKRNIGYFIAYDHLFSTWIEKGSDFDVSQVRDGLSAFSRLISPNHKLLFDGILQTLETGLSKLGDTAAQQTKAIRDLIQMIKEIPMDGRQDYYVLGFIYEYLIGQFAANAGKKAGEFYTPHEVSVLMSEIIADHVKDKETIDIYDSCSGSASLLLNIGRSVAKHLDDKDNIKYYAQELKEATYNLTRMNLVMRGIKPSNIHTRRGDTLDDDWSFFEDNDPVNTYNPLYLDAVVSNPPYSQKWDPEHKDNDARFSRFGLAPKTKADYAFLLHDLYHLKPDGIMAIVLPHGVLFRGGEEGAIRKQLIENDHIDAIIGLPPNIFFGTGIPTIIIVLKQKRQNNDVLIVDAARSFAKEGKNNKLQASDIKKIVETVNGRLTVPRYSEVVSKSKIRENDYNLNIPRYVDSSDPAESWDLHALMFGGVPHCELDALKEYWNAFPGLRAALFTDNGMPYVQPKVDDLAETIRGHADVQGFTERFSAAFADLRPWLRGELIDRMPQVSIHRQEPLIGDAIFQRLEPLPLLDKYHAYQLLDNGWQQIAIDLEIMQTEGFEAAKQVDPNMVTKKKKGKEVEEQEGWKGHVLPFDLVQRQHHKDELDALQEKENRLAEIEASFEDTLEGLSEEEKEAETVHESGDRWVNAIVKKEAKQFRSEMTAVPREVTETFASYNVESYEAKIIQVNDWLTEETMLKAAIKKDHAALHNKTKETIENLSDDQLNELLEAKWILPLGESLHELPEQQIEKLTDKLNALVQKYKTTYADNARAIMQTESELAAMMGDLEGNEFDMKGLVEMKNILGGRC